jgi:transposase InsO family protein
MSRKTSRGIAPIGLLCAAFGRTRQAYYAAKQRIEQASRGARIEGCCGSGQGEIVPLGATSKALLGVGGGERPGACVSAAELVAGIRSVVARFPAWGVRKVWARLRREGLRVSRKRVWKTMHALGLTLPPLCERAVPLVRGQVAVAESNRRWATDLTTAWTAREGWVALVPLIDCGDRFAFELEVTKAQEAAAVLAPLERALVGEFGAPEAVPDGLELRSDHGPQYTGADAEALCARWRLAHFFAAVGRPTGNAVVERFIETLKVELVWTRDWESLDELREAVREWLHVYNCERPHQALEWKTPAEKRAENLGRERLAA